MASNLLNNGYPVTVYDIDPEAIQRLVDAGATPAKSGREVAEKSEIVITSLPTPSIVESSVLGKDGILEGLMPGKIYFDMSTIDPDTTRKIGAAVSEVGAHMLDVPVGLGPGQAATGNLVLMIGGERGMVDEVQDVLDTLGKEQFYCGPLGNGISTKLINNLVSMGISIFMGEVFTLAVKAGLDPEHVREVLKSTAANNRHLDGSLQRMFDRKFEASFKLSLAYKDLGLAAQLANSLNVPNLMGSAANQIQKLAMGKGLGDEDQCAAVKVIEEIAGVELGLPKD